MRIKVFPAAQERLVITHHLLGCWCGYQKCLKSWQCLACCPFGGQLNIRAPRPGGSDEGAELVSHMRKVICLGLNEVTRGLEKVNG